jgi:hypothetical protein
MMPGRASDSVTFADRLAAGSMDARSHRRVLRLEAQPQMAFNTAWGIWLTADNVSYV